MFGYFQIKFIECLREIDDINNLCQSIFLKRIEKR